MNWLCQRSLFATLITLLVIVAGGLGSVWSPEIRAAFPFALSPGWRDSFEARAFWMVSATATLLFFLRQRAVDQVQTDAQRDIVERARELARLIRTLPPANFLVVFGQLHGQSAKVVEAVLGPPAPMADRAVAEQGVRHILRCLAILAQKFDGDHPSTRYAANLMRFHPTAGMDDATRRDFQARLRFTDEGTSVHQLKGVLELLPVLSTLATDEKAEPDPQLRPLCLPMPNVPREKGRCLTLPGAPWAFAEREPSIHVNVAELAQWCEKHGDFTQGVRQRLADYFQHPDSTQVQSFISIPLCPNGDDGLDDKAQEPLAILNIHCDRPSLLHLGNDADGREPMSHFVDISRPLRLNLAQTLVALFASPVMPPAQPAAMPGANSP